MSASVEQSSMIPENMTESSRDPYAALLRIESQSSNVTEFVYAALRYVGEYFVAPYGLLNLRQATSEINEEYHSGPTNPAFWRPGVRDFLNEGLSTTQPRARILAAENAELRVALIAACLRDAEGEVAGGIALVIKLEDDAPNELAVLLDGMAGYISRAVGHWNSRAAQQQQAAAPNSQALSHAASAENVTELAFQLTNTLRTRLECSRVGLSLVHGARVKVLSISGFDEVKRRSPGVVQMKAAMEECLDAQAPVWLNHDRSAEGIEYRLHRDWRAMFKHAAVASIPLRHDGQITAIISLQRDESNSFSVDEIAKIQAATEPYIGALLLVQKARRTVLDHAFEALRGHAGKLFGPGAWGRKLMTAGLVMASAYFVLGSYDYRVSVPCRISPITQRHLTMPYQAVLAEVPVMTGDLVAEGDVLCVLDHRELLLERNDLQAQRMATEQQQLSALAERKPVEAALAEAELRVLTTRLAIVQRKIDQATVRSPIEGIVVRGDLRTRIGAVLPQGEPLFEVAPTNALKLELEIPEEASAGVVSGLNGRFATYARPEQAHEFRITHVNAGTELVQGTNIYRAEADAGVTGEWVKYGMEGVARIDIGARPVWWVVLRRVIDPLRLNFWL